MYYSELFSLLTSLSPDVNKEKEKKNKNQEILRKENEKYYFVSKKIIKALVQNIVSKSACSTLNNFFKLILAFSKTSTKEYIELCLNPKQMAQIISKLLDKRYKPYVNDLISLLENFIAKYPERRKCGKYKEL